MKTNRQPLALFILLLTTILLSSCNNKEKSPNNTIDLLTQQAAENNLKNAIRSKYIQDYISFQNYEPGELKELCYYVNSTITSCFETKFDKEWMIDLNKDGNRDIIFEFTERGQGSGNQNRWSKELVVALLNSQGNPLSFHVIPIKNDLGDNQLKVVGISQGQIIIESLNNSGEVQQSTLYVEGDDLVESSLETCLKENDTPTFFNQSVSNNLQSLHTLNLTSGLLHKQKFNAKDGSSYLAIYGNCPEFSLYYNHMHVQHQIKSSEQAWQMALKELDFLELNSNYGNEIIFLRNIVENQGPKAFKPDALGNYEMTFTDSKSRSIHIHISKNSIQISM